MLGHALAEKRGDVRACRQLFKLRQAGEIELRFGSALGEGCGGYVRICSGRHAIRRLRLLLALRPAGQKTLGVVATHAPPFPRSVGTSPASRLRSSLVRSRLRL